MMSDLTDMLDEIQDRTDLAWDEWEHDITCPAVLDDDSETSAEYLAGALTGDGPPFVVWVPATEGALGGYTLVAATVDGPHASYDAYFFAHARDDVPRLVAALRAVLAVHREVQLVFSWSSGMDALSPCPDCHGAPGVHPCGCWADQQIEYVCEVCKSPIGMRNVGWPCPTVRAITEALGVES